MDNLLAINLYTWYVGGVIAAIFVGLVATPGRIGRIVCHWGLHDTHEVPGYPGHMRVVCVRCGKRLEVST